MKKGFKPISVALLVLPLVAGCGKNGPKFSKKGIMTQGSSFSAAYQAAQKAAKWNIEGAQIEGGVINVKGKSKSVTTQKRGSKLISKNVEKEKETSKFKFDGTNHIAHMKSTTVEKDKTKGIGIKKDVEITKEVTKAGIEQYSNLVEGVIYGIAQFDYLRKEYNPVSGSGFEDPSDLNEVFQTSIKSVISNVFSIGNASYFGDLSTEEAYKYTFYVNGNIFTVEYNDTETTDADDNGGYYTSIITETSKIQLNLNPGKYRYEYFNKFTETRTYVKPYDGYAIGDVYKHESVSHSVASGKEKKVHLKAAKISKYKNLSEAVSDKIIKY